MGVIHRDVKPSNLLLAADGTVKVADLGLAAFRGLPADADPAPLAGTADFAAPEQAGGAAVDHRADVYALGCTLFFLLTGRPVFPRDSVPARLQAHRDAPVPSLRAARPDVPPALDDLFQKLVAKTPADRPQSMDAVVAALDAVRPGDRRRWRLYLPLIAVAAVLIALGLRAWPGNPPGSTPPASDAPDARPTWPVQPMPGTVPPPPTTVAGPAAVLPPHAPRPDDGRPLAEKAKRLNDLTTWRVQKGRWTQAPAGLVGAGDSHLTWGERLPCPVVLEFDMTVVKGMRPRVYLDGTGLYAANEGYKPTFGLYGRDPKEVRGDRVPYQPGETVAVKVVITPDAVSLWVDGRERQSTQVAPPPFVGLSIQGGDGWSPGETAFANFRLSVPGAGDATKLGNGQPGR
jgi:hypothetical protein